MRSPGHWTFGSVGMGKRGPQARPFWTQVRFGRGCWEWTGARFSNGYGRAWVDGKSVGSHRVAYELTVGPIPNGLVVMHACDNTGFVQIMCPSSFSGGIQNAVSTFWMPPEKELGHMKGCVRPEHLSVGSTAANLADMSAKG